MDALLEHTGKGFLTMLIIAMPAVLTAAAIGLVVGILQAVTQVQEQTIAAAPKVLGVFIVIMVMGPFSTKTLMTYFNRATNIAFHHIPKDEAMVLSKNEFFKYKKQILEEQDEKYQQGKLPKTGNIMKNPGKVPFVDNKHKESLQKPPKGSISNPNLIERQKINSSK